MSTNEDTILSQYVPGFKANLNLAPQQTDTKLLSTVDEDLAYDVPGQMFNADDVGRSDPENISTRVPDTPDKFVGMTRRLGYFQPFQDAAWLDNVDKARELVDPTNKIMMALMAGRWRMVDKAIMAAALGLAYSKTDDTSAPSSSSLPAGQVVASTDVSAAHDGEVVPTDGSQYGLSVGKILRAGFLLDESELEGERFWI
ncbi:MAG TPA: phage capsid protein, partial [Caulobacteraceae bacterium]|nr:phage capsid protein [Caulobacteraceae bacterium]